MHPVVPKHSRKLVGKISRMCSTSFDPLVVCNREIANSEKKLDGDGWHTQYPLEASEALEVFCQRESVGIGWNRDISSFGLQNPSECKHDRVTTELSPTMLKLSSV